MSLKTKGFSRKTEALIWIGGGENRTGTVRLRFYIDKSEEILRQFTQILRTQLDETGIKRFRFLNAHVMMFPIKMTFLVL
jgi:hypothetical protein